MATTGDPNAGLAEVTAQAYEEPTPGSLVVNGGFETPPDGGSTLLEYATGSTAIPGWTMGGDSVDVPPPATGRPPKAPSRWTWQGPAQARSARRSPPRRGQSTRSAALAGNTNCGASVKTMDVKWNQTVVDAPTFDTAGESNSSMGYVQQQVTVTATGSSAVLTFADATATKNTP